MSNITVLKKDEKLFNKIIPEAVLTGYFKTKDNSLRIALFSNNEFIAIETPKNLNIFKQTVLEQDDKYILQNYQTILKSDGSIDYAIYRGIIDTSEKK
jgi:hypothetical protein